MSRKVVFLIVILGIVSLLSATDNINFGAKAGLNISDIHYSKDAFIEPDKKFDFVLGAFVEFQVTTQVYIQPELLYTKKGASYESSDSGENYSSKWETTWDISYLQMPVLAKFKPNQLLGIYLGPSLGILLSSEDEYDTKQTMNGETISSTGTEDMKDTTSSTDLSLIIGSEFYYQNFVFDLRYDFGLSNISDVETLNDAELTNRTLSLLVGYTF